MDTKDIYPCFTNLDDIQHTEEGECHELKTPSNPATPCTPVTPLQPHSPNTPASHSISDDTDKSAFSLSMDSGLGSPDDFNLAASHIVSVGSLVGVVPPNKPSRSSKAVDHTNKEKQRRERIKESCDQLRVLLPYIRGRKTDMASTLEMCVDYLHIVNTFMPQTLQDQIVGLLTKDAPLVPEREGLKRSRKGKDSKLFPDPPSVSTSSSSLPSPSAGLVPNVSLTDTIKKTSQTSSLTTTTSTDIVPTELRYVDSKGTKRIRLPDMNDISGESSHLDGRLDPTGHAEVKLQNYLYHSAPASSGHSGNSLQELEEQSYTRLYSGSTFTESYNTPQQFLSPFTATTKNTSLDADTLRPMYVDSTLYHYYPSVIPNTPSQSRMFNPSTEYVNPNTVLPGMPFGNMRLKPMDGMKEENGGRSNSS